MNFINVLTELKHKVPKRGNVKGMYSTISFILFIFKIRFSNLTFSELGTNIGLFKQKGWKPNAISVRGENPLSPPFAHHPKIRTKNYHHQHTHKHKHQKKGRLPKNESHRRLVLQSSLSNNDREIAALLELHRTIRYIRWDCREDWGRGVVGYRRGCA